MVGVGTGAGTGVVAILFSKVVRANHAGQDGPEEEGYCLEEHWAPGMMPPEAETENGPK